MDAIQKFNELKQGNTEFTFYDPATAPLAMYGLMPDYRRLPREVAEQTSEGVLMLHANTAGGRIRFRTDSQKIVLLGQYPNIGSGFNLCRAAQSCFDLYADGEYLGTYLMTHTYADAWRLVALLGVAAALLFSLLGFIETRKMKKAAVEK